MTESERAMMEKSKTMAEWFRSAKDTARIAPGMYRIKIPEKAYDAITGIFDCLADGRLVFTHQRDDEPEYCTWEISGAVLIRSCRPDRKYSYSGNHGEICAICGKPVKVE